MMPAVLLEPQDNDKEPDFNITPVEFMKILFNN